MTQVHSLLLTQLTVGLVACTASGGSSHGPQAVDRPNRPARVVAMQTLGPRLRDLTIDSPALGRRAKVRLLLPAPLRRRAGPALAYAARHAACSMRPPAAAASSTPAARPARSQGRS